MKHCKELIKSFIIKEQFQILNSEIMIEVALILGLITLTKAEEFGSDDLLKTMNQRISNELLMADPFWTNTMIPVAVCLAVVLLIVSIFAVSLIAIKALNEPEPAFATFAPPGFDALWERNIQAELGMNNSRRSSLETIIEEEEIPALFEQKKAVKLPEIGLKTSKIMIDYPLNIPMEPPKPTLSNNSKTGLELVKAS